MATLSTATNFRETAADKARYAAMRDRVCMARKLFKGAWRQLLKDLSQFYYPSIKNHRGTIEELMAKVNAYRLAVMTHTKFLALNEPTISFADGFEIQAERWNEISRECLFGQRFFESILMQYRDSIAWWRITARGGRACLSIADSLQVFPLGAFGHDDQPRSVDLRWVITRQDASRRDVHYLRVERHTPGLIENFAYRVGGKYDCAIPEKAAPIDLRTVLGDEAPEPEQSTGVDRPLLFRAALCVVDDEPLPLLDKEDFDLLDANAKALSQLLMNQDRHGSPYLRVGEGHLEKDGTFDASKRARIDPDKQIEYIDFDAKVVEGLDAFARLLRYLMIQLEMSPELIGLKEGAAAESMEKLMLQAIVTTSRAQLTKQTNEPVLERVIDTACAFDAQLSPVGYPTAPVEVKMHPGLPRTPEETNRGLAEMHTAGQISQETMLKEIHGPVQGPEELQRIQAESKQRTEALIGAGFPSATLSGGDEPGAPGAGDNLDAATGDAAA